MRAAAGVLALQQTWTPVHGNVVPTPSNPYGLPLSIPVDGVDPASQQLGPLSQARVISGRGLTASGADSDVTLVDSGYARTHHLHVGSVITLAHHDFRVVGIVSQPAGTVPDLLIPIRVTQALSGFRDEITTVYVAVAGTADLGTVTARVKAQWPWADVTTSETLASEISGSLGETARLAKDLGRWLAIAVLAAAFVLAALLTLTAVSRRVREFGTLKALGWPARRITAQVLGESVTIGTAGALAGTVLGYAAAAVISLLARNLTATVAAAPGHTEPKGFVAGGNARTGQHFFHPLAFPGTYNSLPVHFSAPVAFSVVALAVGLGIAGGLLAGWLARRLARRPALPGRRPRPRRISPITTKDGPSMYTFTSVTRTYRKGSQTVTALAGVDAEIADREWLAIQGPTGHGKTTLLQLLGGLDRPTSGTILFDGKNLGEMTDAEITQVRATSIGFIFQTFNLIPTLPAAVNVELALAPLRLDAAERRTRVARALDAVGLTDRARHLPAELSGGQQQRVAIARALVKEPAVLLADEPTGNLDETTRDEIITLLSKLVRDHGPTLVIVTHDSAVAARAQRTGQMRDGRLLFNGAAAAR